MFSKNTINTKQHTLPQYAGDIKALDVDLKVNDNVATLAKDT